MAPKRERPVTTLDDIQHGYKISYGPSSSSFSSIQKSSAHPPASKRGPKLMGGNHSGFCQPALNTSYPSGNNIPCYVIPDIPQADVCEATLQRIHREFLPIIQRRGYQVQSISELCCCGDGLDFSPNTQPSHCRPRRMRVSDNILGYNQMAVSSSSSTTGNGQKQHTIHLRLRHPRKHQQLFSWEDLAGTMAHELAHCVHWSHNEQFFQLMEEIMEEHYQLQLRGGGAMTSVVMSGGKRLGGKKNDGKSRLIHEFGSGHRLGGATLGNGEGKLLSLAELRQLAADAAEARRRQLQRLRSLVERGNVPCVIEILEDDDKRDGDNTTQTNRQKNRKIKISGDKKRPIKVDEIENRRSTGHRCQEEDNFCIIDLSDVSPSDKALFLKCDHCTFQNKPNAIQCAMCLSRLGGTNLDCRRCTFRNDKGCTICQVCSSNLTLQR